MNQRRTTLADVAKAAGVHVTTVSLALRNHPRLPRATRDRLQAMARDLGYVPDPALRALVAYRQRTAGRRLSGTLAYLTHWDSAWGWKKTTAHPEFYEGAKLAAQQLGYTLEHYWIGEPGLTQKRLSRILVARGIKGVILASHQLAADSADQMDWDRFSGVKIDYFPHRPLLHKVTNDQCSIIRLAMKQVVSAGYRRIGFVMHRGWDHTVDELWTAGFLCEQAKLPRRDRVPILLFPEAEPVSAWKADFKREVVVSPRLLQEWYQRYRPDVIISKAEFVQSRLAEMKLRVPQDVSFVDVFLDKLDGSVAGVRQNHARVGALAVEILAGQLHHNKVGVPELATTTIVEGAWYDGRSCPRRGGDNGE